MSLFRQGKENEARKAVTETAARMKPLPKDEQNPPAGSASLDDLMLWLAYKEAKALIQFEMACRRSRVVGRGGVRECHNRRMRRRFDAAGVSKVGRPATGGRLSTACRQSSPACLSSHDCK